MLTITLDTVRKHRSPHEYRNVNRATCNGHEIVGDGYIVSAMCKLLAANGEATDQFVDIKRDGRSAFRITTLEAWVNPPKQEQPDHLRRK